MFWHVVTSLTSTMFWHVVTSLKSTTLIVALRRARRCSKVRSTKSGKKFSGQELGVNRRINSNPRYRGAQLDETHRKNTLLLPSANYSLFSPFSPLQGRYFSLQGGGENLPCSALSPHWSTLIGGSKYVNIAGLRKRWPVWCLILNLLQHKVSLGPWRGIHAKKTLLRGVLEGSFR